MAALRRKNSKRKGKAGENEIVRWFLDRGIEAKRTGYRQVVPGHGEPDILLPGMPWAHVEIKRSETFAPYRALEHAAEDAEMNAIARHPVVFHRRSRKPWIMICYADVGADCLRGFQELIYSGNDE